jgi:hypothetical protein
MQETINYPAGSDQVYTLPLPGTVTPGITDIVFTAFNGRQFAVPSDRMILAQHGALSVEGPDWVAANYFLNHPTTERGRPWVVEVVSLSDLQVDTIAASGVKAESTEAQYSIAGRTMWHITGVDVATGGSSMIDPVSVNTQAVGSYSGCSCVLTQNPCGDRLAVVLFAPGTYVP